MILCRHDSTWFHLNFFSNLELTNAFLMEMLFLSYVNELCIYPRLSVFRLAPPKAQNQKCLNKPVCFTHTMVLLVCVNKTMYLLGNLPFFKIHFSCFMAQDDSTCASVFSRCMLWERGLVPLS